MSNFFTCMVCWLPTWGELDRGRAGAIINIVLSAFYLGYLFVDL